MGHTEQDRLGASRAPSETPSPYEATAFAIVSPYGDFWSRSETWQGSNVFIAREDAERWLARFWGRDKAQTRRFTVIPVRVRIEPLLTDGAPLTPQDDAAEAVNGMNKDPSP